MVSIKSYISISVSNSSLISRLSACFDVSPSSIFPPGNSRCPLNSPYPLAVANILLFYFLTVRLVFSPNGLIFFSKKTKKRNEQKEAELHLKNPASIYLIQNICLSLLDIVNNPLSYFLCTVFGTIGHLNFRCTYVFIQ